MADIDEAILKPNDLLSGFPLLPEDTNIYMPDDRAFSKKEWFLWLPENTCLGERQRTRQSSNAGMRPEKQLHVYQNKYG